MRINKLTALLLALLLLPCLSGCKRGADTGRGAVPDSDGIYTIRIGCTDQKTSLLYSGLSHFAAAVKDRSKGRIVVEIYPEEELGTNAEMLRMVENGTLDAMMVTYGVESRYVCPELQLLSLPFLFSDYDHVYRVLDSGIGEELLVSLRQHNIIQLAYWENGMRQITNSVRPIYAPEDLEGLRIRIPEDAGLTAIIMEAYGATSDMLPLSEVYNALQSGEFDGQENSIHNICDYNLQEVQPYLAIVNYQYQPKNMIFSLSTWEKLPPELQDILRENAVLYGKRHWADVRNHEEAQLSRLQRDGMIITYPDTSLFVEQGREVYEDFFRSNPRSEDLVQRIMEMR